MKPEKDTTPPNASRFEFVTVASHRAHQLLQGCTPRVEAALKPARTALREVQAGAIVGERVQPAAAGGDTADKR
jgi:DNA-directed RNA polymerase omega subunit